MTDTTSADGRPYFRFSPNAYELGIFERVAGKCDVCGVQRELKYASSFYSREDPAYICAWCVADGSAARVFDGEFSDYLGIEGVSHDEGEPSTVDAADAEEVATRTPSYPSWQQEEWRAHCGRPCAFLGFIGADELSQYLGEPDFADDVDGGLGWSPELLRTALSREGDLAGYLFQCVECGAHRLHVDAS
ncbi:CbrC family protein [Compostimonas suwonensis]|uniref:CbrC family protein n=1 Tax=Compostimonas suwonensis TaxID=1048394 RepID=A0A2M9C0J2_9MICO|nr:CbrC family protein [Compostimonas suwonensis]PJJ63810.1 hypothetical protein CLV54_1486 [Compostimonas suwonensis]